MHKIKIPLRKLALRDAPKQWFTCAVNVARARHTVIAYRTDNLDCLGGVVWGRKISVTRLHPR
jgi:hypothetical protein